MFNKLSKVSRMIITISFLAFSFLLFSNSISVFAQTDPAAGNEVNINTVNANPVTWNPSQQNFNELLYETIDPIKENIETNVPYAWVDGIVVFVIDLFKTYIFPLTIVLAILTAIFGFMDIMQNDSEEKRKKWTDYFIRGTIGIIIFMGAEFIFNNLYGIIWELQSWQSRNVYAAKIYINIVYPFVKLAMYLVMGWLFVALLVKAIWYVTNPSEKVTEQGRTIIISAASGIIVIILAKTIVEAVYNKQSDITANSSTVFVGWGLLKMDPSTYTILFNVINYLLGLSAFIILCLIIYQSYLMLFNSNTDESLKKMRKNLLYIFAGLVLIWLSYVIVNVLIIN